MGLFRRSRKTIVQRELPKDNGDDSTGVLQVRTQNHDVEWPHNNVFSRIDSGGSILSLTFLACGTRVASLCERDNKIQLWSADSERLEEIHAPMEHGPVVNAISTSKDGRWIVSGDSDGVVVIWDAIVHPIQKAGEFKAANENGREITALDVSPDSSCVVVGLGNGSMAVWRLATRERTLGPLQQQNLSPVSSIKFSPAGGRIASGHLAVDGGDFSIRLWHSYTGAQLESIRNPHSTYSLAWSVDGHRLFAGGPDGSIKCFDVLTRALVEWRAPSVRDLITFLCVSNGGQFLVSVSSGRTSAIDIWNILTVPVFKPLCSRDEVLMASVSPDDTRLITVGRDNDVTLWDLSTLIHRTYLSHRLSLSAAHSNPVTYVSNAVLGAWKCGNLAGAEEKLGEEIGLEDEDSPSRDFYARINRALLRVRLEKWDDALRDVQAIMEQPDNGQTNLIAHIAEGVARHGQGNCKEAIDAFKLALRDCNRDILDLFKCIKSITFLQLPDEVRFEIDTHNDLPVGNLHRLVEARKLLLLIRRDHRMAVKDYQKILGLLKAVPDLAPLLHLPEVKTISLIFDWDLHGLISEIHELRCRALFESHQSTETAVNYFQVPAQRTDDLSEELEFIQARLSLLSEDFGDEAQYHGRYDEAIAWYSEALVLTGYPSDLAICEPEDTGKATVFLKNIPITLSRCPQCIAHLLAKRSEVKAKMKSWTDALTDATRAIESDLSYPWGYERKFMALHALGHFEEAVGTLRDMSSKFTDNRSLEIHQVRNYSKTINGINSQINAIFDKSPFVLINVEDGHMYNHEKQRNKFEKDPRYYALVSELSMTTTPDMNHIKEVVEGYFGYVMFSHTWEGEEPSFEVVSGTSVYHLAPSLLNEKLRKFCETIRDDYKPYRWAWSDTCCIDKTDRDIFEKSIRFMYKWYNNSALTVVLLAHPSKSNPPNSPYLEHNRWIFRAWTLQELLAPRVIRFYNRNWELYSDGGSFNHKMLPELQGGMIGVEGALRDDFSPAALTVRQRLRLASTRDATVKVDIAYALIGIFSSDINVEYAREGEVALGLLLQEIVNRQGDITVLDWIGIPSKFNSSVPANLSVYKPGPYKPYELPPITDNMVAQRARTFHDTPLEEEATSLHNLLSTLGLPRFADRRLSLPCIVFSVTGIKRDTSCGAHDTTYLASTVALGEVQFKTKDTFFSKPLKGRVVLVYPWIRDLLVRTRTRDCDRFRGGKHTRALRLIMYLEQGFRALLFAEQSDQQYRRVAADEEISIPPHELTSLEDISIEVLEIWEKS